MSNKVVFVKSVEDLEKLRDLTNVKRLTIFVVNDILFDEGYYFLPIDLKDTDVIVHGLCNTICNLSVNNKKISFAGLFGSIKSLYVKNLRVKNAMINSCEVNGVVAGRVDGDVIVDGLEADSLINSDAISGGIVGVCNNIKVKNSRIFTTISGKGVLGGLAGMADNFELNHSILNASFIPKYSNRNENMLIDQYVGYLGSRENSRVALLTEEVNDYIEKHNYQKKLWM